MESLLSMIFLGIEKSCCNPSVIGLKWIMDELQNLFEFAEIQNSFPPDVW